jgi:hypothetical protein
MNNCNALKIDPASIVWPIRFMFNVFSELIMIRLMSGRSDS